MLSQVWHGLLFMQMASVVFLIVWFQTEAAESTRQHLRKTNVVPVAQAGADQVVNEEDGLALLSGQASDADGDTVSYFWSELSDLEDACSLRTATLAQPVVELENRTQEYSCTFQLQVSDGLSESSDEITILVQADNDAPQFISAQAVSASEGLRMYWDIWLHDPEGVATSVIATDLNADFQTAGVTLAELFSDLTGGHAVVDWTPSYQQAGTYVLGLSGTDGVTEAEQTVTIVVNDVNVAPQYVGGELQLLVSAGQEQPTAVNLHSLFSDADQDQLTFTVQESAPIAVSVQAGKVLVSSTQAEVGSHVIRFVAADDQGQVAISPWLAVVVSDVGTSSDIVLTKGTKRGKGRVQLLDSSGQVVDTFVAFAMGGVVPRLVETAEQTVILAVKKDTAKNVALFSLSGEMIYRGILSTVAEWKPLFLLDADKDVATTEVLLMGKRGHGVVFSIVQIQADFSLLEWSTTYVPNVKSDQLSVSFHSGVVRGVNERGEEVFSWVVVVD